MFVCLFLHFCNVRINQISHLASVTLNSAGLSTLEQNNLIWSVLLYRLSLTNMDLIGLPDFGVPFHRSRHIVQSFIVQLLFSSLQYVFLIRSNCSQLLYCIFGFLTAVFVKQQVEAAVGEGTSCHTSQTVSLITDPGSKHSWFSKHRAKIQKWQEGERTVRELMEMMWYRTYSLVCVFVHKVVIQGLIIKICVLSFSVIAHVYYPVSH